MRHVDAVWPSARWVAGAAGHSCAAGGVVCGWLTGWVSREGTHAANTCLLGDLTAGMVCCCPGLRLLHP